MNLLHPTPRFNPRVRRFGGPRSPPSIRWTAARISIRSSSLPFSPEKAKHYKELEAAVDVVQRACHLCVDVKGSLLSGDRRILEKNDRTPVTVADFGVQALISLELGRLFPSIPMVAEEDSAVLRLNSVNYEQNADDSQNFLLDAVYSAVADKANPGDKLLSSDDVLESIDRGGRDAVCFEAKPATYWVLDPIDGTRGFLKGDEALYVVGLALVVDGEIVLGVMGCPNWKEDISLIDDPVMEGPEERVSVFGQGTIMVSHAGCGTWRRGFPDMLGSVAGVHDGWVRCFVDSYNLVHDARFCTPDSQTWESLPLSAVFKSIIGADCVRDKQEVLLLPTCCGSLCKYLMVASGRASVFILRARVQTEIKVWDHAVGVLCVHEAGGKVTDWKGSQLDLAEDHTERRVIFPSGGVLVTNGNLHKQILEMISAGSPVH